jgi:isoquinoline 1-oxidoreductase beta subunit
VIVPVSRRGFLKAGAGACLLIGIGVQPRRIDPDADAVFAPGPYLSIDARGLVAISGFRSEMGQGVHTAIAMIVAEELDADWRSVRIESIAPDPRLDMGTSGSRSIRENYTALRRAGAAARAVLLQAAAVRWNVPLESLELKEGIIRHPPTGRRLRFADVAAEAARLPLPAEPQLKDPADFHLIGKPIPRVDTAAKVDGSARFGIDVRVPGLRYACVVRPPVAGATLTAVDESAVHALAGVRLVRFDQSVAAVAANSWTAMRAAALLRPTWSGSPHADLDSDRIRTDLLARSRQAPVVARNDGDAPGLLNGPQRPGLRCISAEYEVPYLAHATMEPQNCTAWVRPGQAELWVPTQQPQRCLDLAVELTALPKERVVVHTTYLGGGFGRRGQTDFAREALLVSRAIGGPVQVLWTREDDMRHDFYRPATHHRFAAAVGSDGMVRAWHHCATGQSIRQFNGTLAADGIDPSSLEGSIDMRYTIPHFRVDYCRFENPVPVGAWRSVGHSQNVFVVESFWDEVAGLAGADPLEFRLRHLADQRLRGVLELAAARAGWGSQLPTGQSRGIACAASYGSYAAEVAEVSVTNGRVRVHRVIAAIDCGQVINPDTVRAQIEGSIVYGLTAALYGEITHKDGRVVQRNFDDYPLLRMPEMPRVEVYIVAGGAAPGGVGEPGTPPIAPAVANAVFAATGQRIRRLPIRLG